jgi:uncharacterized protein with PQ loop repeat
MAINMPQLATILQSFSYGVIIKAMCMAGNILVQVSPFPQVTHWAKLSCTGDADAAPYVSIAFSGWQWCFYGSFAYLLTKQSGFLILVDSNCLGAILGTYYVYTFYCNCFNPDTMSSLSRYLTAVGTLVIFEICTITALPPVRALFITGLVASFCSFVGAMSMLVAVPTVIRSGDSATIPGLLVSANFASALTWCACGWMLGDPLVYGPNIASACSSFVCIYLKFKYRSKDEYVPKLEEDALDLDRRTSAKHAAAALNELFQPRPRNTPTDITTKSDNANIKQAGQHAVQHCDTGGTMQTDTGC